PGFGTGEALAAQQPYGVADHRRRTPFTAQETADGGRVVEKALQHRQVGGAVLRVCELVRGGLRIAVSKDNAPRGGNGPRHQTIRIAILETVTVQVVSEGGVSCAAHEQRMPRGIGVVKVSGDRAFLRGDESA